MKPGDALRSLLRQASRSPGAEPTGDFSRPLAPGSPAPAISGVAPDGSPVAPEARHGRLTLVFLTSECRECEAAWRDISGDPTGRVVVTPGPETESSRRVVKLSAAAPEGGPLLVVMSSAAWHAYGVAKAPWVVDIEDGTIVRSGPLSV